MKTTPKRLAELTKMNTARISREDINNLIYDCRSFHRANARDLGDPESLVDWIKITTSDAKVLAEIGRRG